MPYNYASTAVTDATHRLGLMYRPRRRQGAASDREQGSPSIWDSSEAWAACAKALREYDEDMIQDWKEEIDTLLVFVSIPSCYAPVTNTTTALSHMLTPRLGSTGWSVFCSSNGIHHSGIPVCATRLRANVCILFHGVPTGSIQPVSSDPQPSSNPLTIARSIALRREPTMVRKPPD